MLLLDSWTSYIDQQAINEVKFIEKKILIKTITKKATGLIKSLDRFFLECKKVLCERFIIVISSNNDTDIYKSLKIFNLSYYTVCSN